MIPLDHPTPERPHRVYLALTNHCNRRCPWCSTYSSPERHTWLEWPAIEAALPKHQPFEVQLEGGEPTLHPDFWQFVARLRAMPGCRNLVLSTNGVAIPRQPARLRVWLTRLGGPLLVKLSINHHLLEHDPGLLSLAKSINETLARLGGQRAIVCNVRLRKGYADDDRAVRTAVEQAGLLPIANVFFLQRYGLAEGESGWEAPFLAGQNFSMVNPDGQRFGPDLPARSAAMGKLA